MGNGNINSEKGLRNNQREVVDEGYDDSYDDLSELDTKLES